MASAAPYPRMSSIAAEFETVLRRAPDRPAVRVGRVAGEAAAELSYAELGRRSDGLAARLAARGVGAGDFVAVALERSPDLIVALLGILKAGAAYVPLDPGYPTERLRFMIEDSAARVLVTQPSLRSGLPVDDASVLPIDAATSTAPARAASVARSGSDPAYVIYTSGSTGRPKGVVVPQRGVLRLVLGSTYTRLDASRVVLQLAPVSFDAATFEIWAPLLNGGVCVLYPRAGIPDYDELGAVLRNERVNTLWLTSSLFNAIIDHAPQILAGVEELLVGGEALSVAHVRKAQAQLSAQLVNGYGPTESTTFACCYRIPSPLPESTRSISIGRPIENTQVAILDEALRPVTPGSDGELCIAGDGLALGYHHLPEQTRERFVDAPSAPGGRFYRTGDRVRLLASGDIEFLGRLDTQVKLDGHRIELGEIESQLRSHPALRDAAVHVHQDASGARRLAAYVLPRDCAAVPRPGALREWLAERLPPYLVPHLFTTLDELPLTPNGKLDRGALPEPERRRPELEQPFVPPRSDLERFIAGLWKELLGVDRVGVRDRFFELGGSSLLALRFTRTLGAEIDAQIRIADFFDAPTVVDVARVLNDRHGEKIRARFGVQDAAPAELVEIAQIRTEGRRRRRDIRREGRVDE